MTLHKPKRFVYDPMTAEQFRAALKQLGLDPVAFARLSGKNPRRVQRMLAGDPDFAIPHDVLVLCSLLTLPGALELAERVTAAVIREEDEP